MANDSFTVNLSGISDQSANPAVPSLNISNFQKNLDTMVSALDKANQSLGVFRQVVKNSESEYRAGFKSFNAGLSGATIALSKVTTSVLNSSTSNASSSAVKSQNLQSQNSTVLTNTINALSQSISALNSNIKKISSVGSPSGGSGIFTGAGSAGSIPWPSNPSGGSGIFTGPGAAGPVPWPSNPPTVKSKDSLKFIKTILAAFGFSTLVSNVAESQLTNPIQAASGLMALNLGQSANTGISSSIQAVLQQQKGMANFISSGLGAVAGGIGGSFLGNPLMGAAAGGAAGGFVSNLLFGNANTLEQSAKNRFLELDTIQNIAKNQGNFGQFFGDVFGPNTARNYSEPLLQSLSEFGRGFSPYAGGNINPETARSLVTTSTALGEGDLRSLGAGIGQLVRLSQGSNSALNAIEKSVSQSGLSPVETVGRILALVQTGKMGVSEAALSVQQNAQRGSGFANAQLNYANMDYFQRFSSRLGIKAVSGIDIDKVLAGDEEEKRKAKNLFDAARRDERKNPNTISRNQIGAVSLEKVIPYSAVSGENIANPEGGKRIPFTNLQNQVLDVQNELYKKQFKDAGGAPGLQTSITDDLKAYVNNVGLATSVVKTFKETLEGVVPLLRSFGEGLGKMYQDNNKTFNLRAR